MSDLRQRYGGALALHIRNGKGAKARLIPYGELETCLVYVEAWLRQAAIGEGAVFRGIYKGGQHVRTRRLTVRAVQDILHKYPLSIEGHPKLISPHDLRRTYARRLYEGGVELMALQQNLGHADLRTTQLYVGTLDAHKRQPPAVYRFVHLAELRAT